MRSLHQSILLQSYKDATICYQRKGLSLSRNAMDAYTRVTSRLDVNFHIPPASCIIALYICFEGPFCIKSYAFLFLNASPSLVFKIKQMSLIKCISFQMHHHLLFFNRLKTIISNGKMNARCIPRTVTL